MKTNVLCKAFATAGLAAVVFSACNKVETTVPTDSQVAAKIIAGIQTKASGNTWDPSDAIGITTTGNEKKDGKEYINVKFTIDGTGTFNGSSPIYFQNKNDVTFTAYYPFTDPEAVSYTHLRAHEGVPCLRINPVMLRKRLISCGHRQRQM